MAHAAKDVWSVYDSNGQITQSNKVYDDPKGEYGRILHEREMKFVNHAGETYAHLGRQFVSNGELRDMPEMKIKLSRASIGIGEANGATLKNVPIGSHLTIYAGDVSFFSEKIDGSTVEICAPVPGIYTLVVTQFPYREWRQQVVAK